MNPTMMKDVYKEFHKRAAHPDVTETYENYTNRGGKHSNIKDNDKVAWVGAQYFVLDYLIHEWNTYFFEVSKEEAVRNHKRILSAMLGYTIDVTYLEELWELGYLPVLIKTLDEGTLVPYQVAPLTMVNTVPGYQWLPGVLETVQSTEIWPINTSATTSIAYFKAHKKAFEETGGPMDLLPFMGHDFSFRGMFGRHAAAMSGFGHLASGYAGTDTIPAVLFAEKYYGADVDKELVGASPNATEHSVTCTWIDEGEIAFIQYLIREQTPKGILSIVSDTWDFWRLVTEYLPILKEEIMARDGTVVIRPDSGDPVDIICGIDVIEVDSVAIDGNFVADWIEEDLHNVLTAQTPHGEYGGDISGYYSVGDKVYNCTYSPDWNRHDKQYYYIDNYDADNLHMSEVKLTAEQKGLVECLWDIFGGTTTEKGFKLLDSHIGAIYGDAITLDRQAQIISRLKAKGFVPSVVLGIGSYSFQYVTRDTHGSAVKATHIVKAGKDVAIFKDPKTDSGKKSAKGLLRVEEVDGVLVMYDNQTREQEKLGLLTPLFKDGKLMKRTTLSQIRNKIKEQL